MPVYPTKGWKSAQPSFGFGRRRGCEGIFGPVMFGIAASKLFAYLLVRVGPEAGEVFRDLDRTSCR
jgi:hypothetical protein